MTIGPHVRYFSEYYAGLNQIIDMTDSVNTNDASICFSDFSFSMNPNGPKKYIYILIVYNMLEFPAKGIFPANQVRAAGHFYNDNMRKLGGEQRLVTTDIRQSRMIISVARCVPRHRYTRSS